MQDRSDARQVGCKTERRQDGTEAIQNGGNTAWRQDRTDSRQDGYKIGRVKDKTDTGQIYADRTDVRQEKNAQDEGEEVFTEQERDIAGRAQVSEGFLFFNRAPSENQND